MRKALSIVLTAALTGLFLFSTSQAGIARVAKRINVISFYAGSSAISGKYDGLGADKWNQIFETNLASPDVDGGDLYKSCFHLGFDYGQLRGGKLLYSFGFRYTKVKFQDSTTVPFDDPGFLYIIRSLEDDFNVHLYDLGLDVNYFLFDLNLQRWSPYFGLGGKVGFMTFDAEGRSLEGYEYSTESQIKSTIGVNFGADIKVWSAPKGRSFVTLSSVNSWDLFASGNRPKYLNVGGAIKYYFKP